MYVPPYNALDDEAQMRAFVAEIGAAQLITIGPDGYPASTLLPIIWTADRVIAHLARANPQWRTLEPDSPALFVCQGNQAYISPSWYAAKAEHGRVVPTWNYTAVELRGTVTVYHDTDRLHEAVTLLTHQHENGRDEPWTPADARGLHQRTTPRDRRNRDAGRSRDRQSQAEPEPIPSRHRWRHRRPAHRAEHRRPKRGQRDAYR